MQGSTEQYHDGKLLPMNAIAVNPLCLDDLVDLVAAIPEDLAAKLSRMAAWRALGMDDPFPDVTVTLSVG